MGARSVLMLTGVTTRAQVAALAEADRPTEIAADAAELAAALDRLAACLTRGLSRRLASPSPGCRAAPPGRRGIAGSARHAPRDRGTLHAPDGGNTRTADPP